ncbi:MAG: hypothetical protein M1830_000418, partial [Pleopsidium flavum]
ATPDVAVAASNTPAAAPRAPAAPSAPSASNVVAAAPNVVAAAAVPLSEEVKEVYEKIQFPSQETWTPDMDAGFRKALMEVPGGGLQGHFDKNASGRKNKHPPTPRNCLLSEIGHRACVIPDGEDLRSSCPFCSTPAGADQVCVHLLYVPGVDDPMGTRKANGRYIKDSAKPVEQQTTTDETGKRWVLGVRT